MLLRECKWEPCTTLTIPKDWPSGVYLGKLSATRHRYQGYVIFVVTDDRPAVGGVGGGDAVPGVNVFDRLPGAVGHEDEGGWGEAFSCAARPGKAPRNGVVHSAGTHRRSELLHSTGLKCHPGG